MILSVAMNIKLFPDHTQPQPAVDLSTLLQLWGWGEVGRRGSGGGGLGSPSRGWSQGWQSAMEHGSV